MTIKERVQSLTETDISHLTFEVRQKSHFDPLMEGWEYGPHYVVVKDGETVVARFGSGANLNDGVTWDCHRMAEKLASFGARPTTK